MKITQNKRKRNSQNGIVLPLTLFLLVAISILGIMAMRNATIGAQTVNSVRSYTIAELAAEAGLRYCEEVAKESDSPSTPAKYTQEIAKIATLNIGTCTTFADIMEAKKCGASANAASWKSSATTLISVPGTSDAGGKFTNPPQCMIERIAGGGSPSYLITARGIGNEASHNSTTGRVTGGAEVWLQSVLTPGSGT